MIRYYNKINKLLIEENNFKKGGWIKLSDPSKEELKKVVENFNLDESMVSDGLDIYELSRVEEENKKVYIYLRVPTRRIENPTCSFLLILSNKGVITISSTNLEIFDEIIKKPAPKNNSQWITLFLSVISKLYNLDVKKILKDVRSEKRQMEKLKNKDIIDLIKQEDTLNDYLASFPLIIETNKQLVKIRSLKLNEEEKEIIEDLEIDLEQTLTNCKFVLKNISNMRNYYSTTLSGNLNKIITILTVFTVLLTIPTTISGIYGMNISLPGQNLPNFFWFLTTLVFIIWFILLIILRWKRVLD